eukprot:444668-Prymnesium_polylepis.1
MQAAQRGNKSRVQTKQQLEEETAAATKLQAKARVSVTKNEMAAQKAAATKVQALKRGNDARKSLGDDDQ